jgi:signal transduction histidine kinase
MQGDVDDSGIRMHLRFRGRERAIVIPQARIDQFRGFSRKILREPFTPRPWRELGFFIVGGLLGVVALAFTLATMVAGVWLLITFVGVILIATSVRGARGIGAWHRGLARSLLQEEIEEPKPFMAKAGFLGWLQSSLRDQTGWRSIAYTIVKAPIILFGVWFGIGTWISAFLFLTDPFLGRASGSPRGLGPITVFVSPGGVNSGGFGYYFLTFLLGVVLFFVAPWTMRAVVKIDTWVMHGLLGPDAREVRMRQLETARTQTVDASAATLRRIERDLHDGTQAQLVALAMRLGQAKEKLAGDDVDLDQVRRLVDEAHGGAKEAIVELRDLARGIHPPALDTGLEGALATLAARSALPTDLTVVLNDRPTPAIESIAYFCVAELLANVAQHAQASRASISCMQHGGWMRLVVRDDGKGGAQPATTGSSSSGLAGLAERVQTVDGRLYITSPLGGPTIVTVDLPLHT